MNNKKCQICFTKVSSKGIYREIGGEVLEIYRACYDCHGRVVKDSVEFGNPEWPKKQVKLEAKFGGVKIKVESSSKPKKATKKVTKKKTIKVKKATKPKITKKKPAKKKSKKK